MLEERFDAVVVGAGPAGAVAALVLARGGARVALVDKAKFPRDKACGDLVGPRGVALLADVGFEGATAWAPGGRRVGDMKVVGPSGRAVRLPCVEGTAYPGYGVAVPRVVLDDTLRAAAVDAGAVPVVAHVGDLVRGKPVPGKTVRDADVRDEKVRGGDGAPGVRSVEGVDLTDGRRLRAATVIGADGATSRVAEAAGLVDARRALWGFALRAYANEPVDLPHIVLWEPTRNTAFAGYGWIFPGQDGRANVGLGAGVGADRRRATAAVRLFPDFLRHLGRMGLVSGRLTIERRLGGWLKMGITGTTPAVGNVLLAGDAAGLVNPLQGEGIAHALTSGRQAADAVLLDTDNAAARYRAELARAHLSYHRVAAAVHAWVVRRPGAGAALARVLTAPGLARVVAGGWAIYWNELLDGAPVGTARAEASAAGAIGRALTWRSATARWFDETWSLGTPGRPGKTRRLSETSRLGETGGGPANPSLPVVFPHQHR